jgi:hypothetical protein
MKYIGWVLFCWGLLNFLVSVSSLFTKDSFSIDQMWIYQILSILTIGVGGYLIKNFTEEK